MWKKSAIRILTFILFLISLIITVNFVVDPGGVYLKRILAGFKADEYVRLLLKSKIGLKQQGWNERLIKTELAKHSTGIDCVIIGSSHVMQISTIRNTGGIQNQCSELLNLGVSGGSIEDLAIFSNIIMHNKEMPKKVFIGIDPWTLKYNMDDRYGENKTYLDGMKNDIKKYKDNSTTIHVFNFKYYEQLAANLVNKEYFLASMKSLFKSDKAIDLIQKQIIEPDKQLDYANGYEYAITLPDGSHLYDHDFIDKATKNIKFIKIDDANYKISGDAYESNAVEFLSDIIDTYAKSNIEVCLILTPYHPDIWKYKDSKVVKHMEIVEELVKKLANYKHLKLYGSFNPNNIGCTPDEFYDFMHPKNECLSRIDFSR